MMCVGVNINAVLGCSCICQFLSTLRGNNVHVSHWPEAVDGPRFPFLPVLEVTERVQPLFSVHRLIQIRSIDLYVNQVVMLL